MTKVVCSVCGSDDVQAKVWTKPNENFERTCDFINELISEPADCWCCNCEENQQLKIVEDETSKGNPPEILRCEECGSTNVQMQGWVDPNNGYQYIGDCEDDKSNWCDECESHVRIVPHNEFMENTVNYWWEQCDGEDREIVSGLDDSDFSTDQQYNDACNTIWNTKTDEEKIAIWNHIVNREENGKNID